jgi:hypothetical protein
MIDKQETVDILKKYLRYLRGYSKDNKPSPALIAKAIDKAIKYLENEQ